MGLNLHRAVREAVIARDGRTCRMCGIPVIRGGDPNAADALNIDHIVQRAIGGTDDLSNLRVVCAGCNRSRPKPVPDESQEQRAYDRARAATRRARRQQRPTTGPDPFVAALKAASPRLSARQRRSLL